MLPKSICITSQRILRDYLAEFLSFHQKLATVAAREQQRMSIARGREGPHTKSSILEQRKRPLPFFIITTFHWKANTVQYIVVANIPTKCLDCFLICNQKAPSTFLLICVNWTRSLKKPTLQSMFYDISSTVKFWL